MNTATPAPALEVRDASKSYGKLKALDGVSVDVGAGEFVALLGPNGAGKSTLFQLLTGLFVADSGSVSVAGFDIRTQAVKALARIGVVFQQATLDLDLSPRANLRFHARLHGLGSGARIDEALERAGLGPQAKLASRTLSGGNRRKVELVRALLHNPSVLLMDEATVGLDPASRRALLETVHELCAAQGMGVLWATHLVDEAESATRVVVLHKGRILRDAPPDEIVAERPGGAQTLSDAFLALIAGDESDPS